MRLNTFGRAYLAREDGQEVALQPLPLAVLAYLAVGGPRNRDHLADLFWPNSKNGLNSLSTTLNRIRAEVPDGVWMRGTTLVGTDLPSDVGDLRQAVERSDATEATELYAAAFLGSLKLRRHSTEFEEWVLEVRTNLASMVEAVLLQRGRQLFESGNHRDAAAAAEEAWGITQRDGFPSPDSFETYHRLLASAAKPSAKAVRLMAQEFGMELPPVEPVALEPPGPAAARVREFTAEDRDHPAGATELFGRRNELDAIMSSAINQRLTTVVGLGGSGKTRLAAEFFNSPTAKGQFERRYWVSLADVADPELVGPAIATSLGQRFHTITGLGSSFPESQPTLLVLDNFEHVLPAATVAEELSLLNPSLRILVTSRVPLEVRPESLVHLRGLDASEHELHSPAEMLFVSSARRAGVGNERLTGLNRSPIREICNRVGGNPLALEITGGWTQVLSPKEILEALSIDNELLGSPMDNDPRTMEAVLAQSWSTLSETEQDTLMLLATFPAGCLTSEALKLPELSIRSIGRLVQHSLVRMHVEGRVTLHPLIARHALAELGQREDRQREFQMVLSRWCRSFASTLVAESRATPSLDAEIANFTSAWSWDAQHAAWGLHRDTLESVRQFFTESGRVSEGQALFSSMVETLRSHVDPPQDLFVAALEALGWFLLLAGEGARARAVLDEAHASCPAECVHTRAQILRTTGALQLAAGEIDEATANFTEGLVLVGDRPSALTASLQFDLAQAHHYRGAREQAVGGARLALQSGRAASNAMVMVRSYLLLADIEVESDPRRAGVLLNEGWVIAQEASLDHLAIYFPHLLGIAHLNLDEADRAEDCFTDGIDAATEIGQMATVCANLVGRAEARLAGGRPPEAIEDLQSAIRLALKTDSGRYLMWAAVVSCQMLTAIQPASISDSSLAQARDLLTLTLRHPAADKDARDKAEKTWDTLFDDTPNPHPDIGLDDEVTALDEIAERSLELLNFD